MGSLRGFSWNCGGLRRNSPATLSKIMYFEKNYLCSFDFFFFLETHHQDKNDIPNELMRYEETHHIIHSETDGEETHSGIIGLIRKDYKVSEPKQLIQGRILHLSITDTAKETTHHISVVYLPTNKNLNAQLMTNIVHNLRLPNENDIDNYIIVGDFNFIDHEKDKKNGLTSKDKQLNQIWEPFLNEMDMVDPFREQNPKRRVWSFIGTGKSRIDRIYVNSRYMNDITNMKYIHTPFAGHKVFAFMVKKDIEWGTGYFKLNTSILEDEEYGKLVDETIAEVQTFTNRNPSEKWEIFLLTMKTKSIHYSAVKNRAKRRVKNELIRQMTKIEENPNKEQMEKHYAYLKERLKEIEDKEIEGYIRRVKYLAPYEKTECDISFYSKLEGQKRANDRINQLAEKKEGEIFTDTKNIMRISSEFYKILYTTEKLNKTFHEKAQNKGAFYSICE